MRRTGAVRLVLMVLVLIPMAASAQEGKVRYTHTFIPFDVPDPSAPLRRQAAAVYGTEYEEETGLGPVDVLRDLFFRPESSVMVPAKQDTLAPEEQRRWEYIDTTYVDLAGNTFTEWRAFALEKYLVTGESPKLPWHLSTESRIYLDYQVMKATAVVDDAVLEAWFTPQIPIPAGPGLYGGLPGLILMVTNPSTGEAYAAESVDLGEYALPGPPTTGRKTSEREYKTIKQSTYGEYHALRDWMEETIESGRHMVVKNPPDQ